MNSQLFSRQASERLSQLLGDSADRQVIIIQGARQVGKTTLVKSLLKSFTTVTEINLETDLRALDEIERTTDFTDLTRWLERAYGFKDQPGALLFIDEAQESEVLGRYVRSFKEQWQYARVILTGSSMSRLFREDQRIPVGRYSSFLLTPMNFVEYLNSGPAASLCEVVHQAQSDLDKIDISELSHQDLLSEFDQFLSVGGLPEVVRAFREGGNWRQIRHDLFLSQQEDFVRKSSISQRAQFSAALKALANQIGSPSKLSQIAEKPQQAKEIIEALVAWQLVYEIEQKGNATTSTFLPKRYIYDIGIAQDLRDHPFPSLSTLKTLNAALRTPLGALFENVVLSELISATQSQYGITGWRAGSASALEVDFISRHQQILPIECKAALKISQRDFRGLLEYLESSQLKTAFLVSPAPFQRYQRSGKVLYNIPIYLFSPTLLEKLVALEDQRTS